MTWLQKKQPKHQHRYFVDADTSDAVCLCGKVQGEKQHNNKYNAQKTEYGGGRFDSKKEAEYAQLLDYRIREHSIQGYKRQVRISFDICARCLRLCSGRCGKCGVRESVIHITNYFIDFIVQENDGSETYTEVKGLERPEWKLKWKLTEALYGDDETKTLLVVK